MAEFSFKSLSAFATHLATLTIGSEVYKHEALEKAATLVEEEAKNILGTDGYEWPALAESTLARKTQPGMLLESGEMRDSIEHTVTMAATPWGTSDAQIGSNLDRAVFHEAGTSKMPPRPFLSGTAMHHEKEIVEILGRGAVKGLVHDP